MNISHQYQMSLSFVGLTMPQRRQVDRQFQRLCFRDIFNGLTSDQLRRLEGIWREHGGVPSRRIIAEISRDIGLAQTRIRRWFKEQSLQIRLTIQPVEDRLGEITRKVGMSRRMLEVAQLNLGLVERIIGSAL